MVIKHADDLLHIPTVLEKRISVERYDESLNLREFDPLERFLECGRSGFIHVIYR